MGLYSLFSYLDCINSIRYFFFSFIETNNGFVTKKKISNRWKFIFNDVGIKLLFNLENKLPALLL